MGIVVVVIFDDAVDVVVVVVSNIDVAGVAAAAFVTGVVFVCVVDYRCQ